MLKDKIAKINRYLLENHPDLWHVRLPMLIVTAICLHLFSFVYGYLYVTPKVLLGSSSFYEGSSYYLFYFSILMIIILFYWGLKFYRNSVIKHFYRASNRYVVKMFFLIFVLLFANLSAILSFSVGTSLAIQQIKQKFHPEELQKEYDFLAPVLLIDSDAYDLANSSVLTKQNLSFIRVNGGNSVPYNYEELWDSTSYIPVEKIDSSKYSLVDDDYVIFYRTVEKETKKGCTSTFLKEIVKLDGYHNKAVAYHHNYTKELGAYRTENRLNELALRMEAFKQKVNEIGDLTNFNPWVNLSYIEAKKWINISYVMGRIYDYDSSYDYDEEAEIYRPSTTTKTKSALPSLDKIDPSQINPYELENSTQNYFFNHYDLENFLSNCFYPSNYYAPFIAIFVISLIVAFLLLQFQFVQFINVIISIPIMAVLFVLATLFTVLTAYSNSNNILSQLFFYTTFWCVFIGLFLNYSSRMTTRWKEVFLILIMNIFPIMVLMGYGALGDLIYREASSPDPCYSVSIDYYFSAPPLYEWHFILLGIVSAIFILSRIKRIVAKPE